MFVRAISLSLLSVSLLAAADAVVARNAIQATYDRALKAMSEAKSGEDLDAINRATDTPDWVSIVNNGPPQHWSDLRPGTIQSLGHFGPTAIRIVKFTLNGDTAIVIARVGAPEGANSVLVRDTWVKMPAGWRRKMHEKPAPGKLDAEVK
jgi:hypothetical protein